MAAFDPSLPHTREYVNQGGLSRAAIFNQVDASLRRLKTSYIDVLQIHAFDASTPLEETMRALHELVVAGKVRYIGASGLRVWQLAEMNYTAERNGWTQFISMQVEHSLLYRTEVPLSWHNPCIHSEKVCFIQEQEMIAYCKYKGIGVISYSPLMDGHLARPLGTATPRADNIAGSMFEKKRRESDKEIIKRVEEIAGKHSVKMCQVALEWSAGKISSPIVGANTVRSFISIPTLFKIAHSHFNEGGKAPRDHSYTESSVR